MLKETKYILVIPVKTSRIVGVGQNVHFKHHYLPLSLYNCADCIFYPTAKCRRYQRSVRLPFSRKMKLLMSEVLDVTVNASEPAVHPVRIPSKTAYATPTDASLTLLISFQFNRKKLTYPGESRVSMMPCSVSAHTTLRYQPEVAMK